MWVDFYFKYGEQKDIMFVVSTFFSNFVFQILGISKITTLEIFK